MSIKIFRFRIVRLIILVGFVAFFFTISKWFFVRESNLKSTFRSNRIHQITLSDGDYDSTFVFSRAEIDSFESLFAKAIKSNVEPSNARFINQNLRILMEGGDELIGKFGFKADEHLFLQFGASDVYEVDSLMRNFFTQVSDNGKFLKP